MREIVQTASAQSENTEIKKLTKSELKKKNAKPFADLLPANVLLQHLSFSHFVELFKVDDQLKRTFYEMESIRGTWNVRELKRQIGSLLFERTGLSKNKNKALAQIRKKAETLTPDDIRRDPNYLDFTGLKANQTVSENQLEDALLEHLQEFMLELGKGFCFEARQKRIQIGDDYFYVDLVFYHRILHCHVIIELKNREFQYADISQMNVYMNYFKKYETNKGDNQPIGILLCTHKNEALVEFATLGVDNQLFVSKYQLALPTKQELQQWVQNEMKHFKNQ